MKPSVSFGSPANAREIQAEVAQFRQADLAAVDFWSGRLSNWSHSATAAYASPFWPAAKTAASEFLGDSLFYKELLPGLSSMVEFVTNAARDLGEVPVEGSAALTLGGTESNLLAVLAAREAARARGHRGRFTLVMPVTGHPSFAKAAHYFGLSVRRVPLGSDFRCSPSAMAETIDDDTVMIVASAPEYCYGLYDDIVALSQIAQTRDVWLHIDAAIGGTLTSFLREQGKTVPPPPFSLPGVRSVSMDLHKHGYAPMGLGTLACRTEQDSALHGFVDDVWAAGKMYTAIINGGRSAAPVAGAYAVLRQLGRDGMSLIAARIADASSDIRRIVTDVPGGEVLGTPVASVLAFRISDCPAALLRAALLKRGFRLNRLRAPDALQALIDADCGVDFRSQFADSLEAAVKDVRAGKVQVPSGEEICYG